MPSNIETSRFSDIETLLHHLKGTGWVCHFTFTGAWKASGKISKVDGNCVAIYTGTSSLAYWIDNIIDIQNEHLSRNMTKLALFL